jgi:hypothetical protein
MSTLRLTTISNQSGSATVPSETVINGSAKAWVNFNGSGTVAIRNSFNVSSITDNGTGTYTINFTNAMRNADYCFSGTSTYDTTWGSLVFPDNSLTNTTTQLAFRVAATNYTLIDALRITVIING